MSDIAAVNRATEFSVVTREAQEKVSKGQIHPATQAVGPHPQIFDACDLRCNSCS